MRPLLLSSLLYCCCIFILTSYPLLVQGQPLPFVGSTPMTTDSLAFLLQKQDSPRQKLALRLALGKAFLADDPEQAFEYLRMAQQQAEVLGEAGYIAESNMLLGLAYFQQSIYAKALPKLFEAQQGFETLGDKEKTADTHLYVGLVYTYSGQQDQSLRAYQKALKLYQKAGSQLGEARALAYIGHVYEKKLQLDTALSYQKAALKRYQQLDDLAGVALTYENIGSILEDLEDYPSAEPYFVKALRLNRQVNNLIALVSNYNNLGDMARKQGRLLEAIAYSDSSLQLAKQLGQAYQVRSALKDLAKTYADMGDFAKAFVYLDESYDQYQALYNDDISQQLARFRTLFEMQEKEREIALLESQQTLDRWTRLSLGAGVLLLLLLGGLVVSRQRLKIKKNQELYKAQHELNQSKLSNALLNEQKLKAELENQLLREQGLKTELEAKNRELSGRALHLIQKNEMLEELRKKLHLLQRKHEGNSLGKEVQGLLQLIDQGSGFDKEWEHFKQTFEQVHQDFFDKLQSEYPALTSGEVKLCSLIKLNLNSQEMASILGISQDSLRVSRYRLRKKLNLPKGSNLSGFIMNL